MEKFIPLRDYILGERIKELQKEEEVKNEFGIYLGIDTEQKELPTNRLIVKEIGDLVVQGDLITQGSEVVFDMKGSILELNGKEFILTKETNLFGVIERV